MTPKRSLSDILHGDTRDRLASAWNSTEAAADFAPLPAGEYTAHVASGEFHTSRTNATPGYQLTFRIAEGEHTGRQLRHDVWLTEAALPMAKRDLGKLGVTTLEQLDKPLPLGIRCRLRVALRKSDDGAEYNAVRSFEVVGIDSPEPDAFAPDDEAEGDASFDPAQLEAAGQDGRDAYDPQRDG